MGILDQTFNICLDLFTIPVAPSPLSTFDYKQVATHVAGSSEPCWKNIGVAL